MVEGAFLHIEPSATKAREKEKKKLWIYLF